jgi:hypothetical protein
VTSAGTTVPGVAPAPETEAPSAGRRSLAARLWTASIGWLPLAVALTVACSLVYGAGQHQFRSSANDPAIQLAEDGVAALAAGGQPVFPSTQVVDLARSVAPFVIVFDEQGKVVRGTAVLDGSTPVPLAGVFAYARTNGEDRFTWQPDPGVRLATVVAHNAASGGGFVLAGSSLREVERRIDDLLGIVVVVWALGLAASLGTALLVGASRR